MSGTVACRHVFVKGRVQGVAFRFATARKAEQLGLAGWVRNLHDGRVEAWIEGAEAPVGQMLAWLEQGPPAARVEQVQAAEESPEALSGFEIRPSHHA